MSGPDRAFNKVQQEWDTPSEAEIPAISQQHVQGMEMTADPAVWHVAGMQHVLIRTIGRKSGQEHKIALPYWTDEDGNRVVVASYAGAKAHPSWYHNLADRDANPELLMKEEDRWFRATVEILDGEEYEKVWGQLVADRAWYADYQAKTERRIPLVRIIDQGDAEAPA